MDQKTSKTSTLGFLIDCPRKGMIMMFPGLIEDIVPEYFDNLEEVDNEEAYKLLGWHSSLTNIPHKTFKKKSK